MEMLWFPLGILFLAGCAIAFVAMVERWLDGKS